jgi:hypothetical protein
MANICELSINVVNSNRPKMLTGRSQNGNAAGTEALSSSVMGKVLYGHAAGGQREPKPILSFERNVVSPYRPSLRWGKPTARGAEDGAGKG